MATNTTFTSGQILTAAQMNNLPFGIQGVQTLTSAFTTSATHTTFQDNGMTLTFNEISGHIYKITALSNLYPQGGQQGVSIQIVRTATALKRGDYSTVVMDTAVSLPIVFSYVYSASSSGSVTYKVQIAAQNVNTSVTDFANATYPRQFIIEDIGAA